MINSQQRVDKTLGAPELTPLIDIVFIVIVFLLITANAPLLTLPIDIPSTSEDSNLQAEALSELTVTITAEKPYWHLEKKAFNNLNELKKALLIETKNKQLSLTIAADRAAPSEPLLQLLAFLNQQKMGNAKIIMQQTSK